jgi:hypothetical protein
MAHDVCVGDEADRPSARPNHGTCRSATLSDQDQKGEYLTGEELPAPTAVGVPALALPGQLIEIKVVALAPT